jgi:hypothetical protein
VNAALSTFNMMRGNENVNSTSGAGGHLGSGGQAGIHRSSGSNFVQTSGWVITPPILRT